MNAPGRLRQGSLVVLLLSATALTALPAAADAGSRCTLDLDEAMCGFSCDAGEPVWIEISGTASGQALCGNAAVDAACVFDRPDATCRREGRTDEADGGICYRHSRPVVYPRIYFGTIVCGAGQA